jgi:hypothetical protein
MEALKKIPVLGALVTFADTRPRIAAWLFLGIAMVVLLVIEARDVGLLPGQWIALIIATLLVAGLCIWIVTFEDSADDTESAETTKKP